MPLVRRCSSKLENFFCFYFVGCAIRFEQVFFFLWLVFGVQLGNFIHYMATFVSGFVVGFTAVWQLALVTLAVVPMIAVIGGIHTTTLPSSLARARKLFLKLATLWNR